MKNLESIIPSHYNETYSIYHDEKKCKIKSINKTATNSFLNTSYPEIHNKTVSNKCSTKYLSFAKLDDAKKIPIFKILKENRQKTKCRIIKKGNINSLNIYNLMFLLKDKNRFQNLNTFASRNENFLCKNKNNLNIIQINPKKIMSNNNNSENKTATNENFNKSENEKIKNSVKVTQKILTFDNETTPLKNKLNNNENIQTNENNKKIKTKQFINNITKSENNDKKTSLLIKYTNKDNIDENNKNNESDKNIAIHKVDVKLPKYNNNLMNNKNRKFSIEYLTNIAREKINQILKYKSEIKNLNKNANQSQQNNEDVTAPSPRKIKIKKYLDADFNMYDKITLKTNKDLVNIYKKEEKFNIKKILPQRELFKSLFIFNNSLYDYKPTFQNISVVNGRNDHINDNRYNTTLKNTLSSRRITAKFNLKNNKINNEKQTNIYDDTFGSAFIMNLSNKIQDNLEYFRNKADERNSIDNIDDIYAENYEKLFGSDFMNPNSNLFSVFSQYQKYLAGKKKVLNNFPKFKLNVNNDNINIESKITQTENKSDENLIINDSKVIKNTKTLNNDVNNIKSNKQLNIFPFKKIFDDHSEIINNWNNNSKNSIIKNNNNKNDIIENNNSKIDNNRTEIKTKTSKNVTSFSNEYLNKNIFKVKIEKKPRQKTISIPKKDMLLDNNSSDSNINKSKSHIQFMDNMAKFLEEENDYESEDYIKKMEESLKILESSEHLKFLNKKELKKITTIIRRLIDLLTAKKKTEKNKVQIRIGKSKLKICMQNYIEKYLKFNLRESNNKLKKLDLPKNMKKYLKNHGKRKNKKKISQTQDNENRNKNKSTQNNNIEEISKEEKEFLTETKNIEMKSQNSSSDSDSFSLPDDNNKKIFAELFENIRRDNPLFLLPNCTKLEKRNSMFLIRKKKYKKRKSKTGDNLKIENEEGGIKEDSIDEKEKLEKLKFEIYEKKLNDFFSKIKKLKNSEGENIDEELDLLIEERLKDMEYPEKKQKEMRMNSFYNQFRCERNEAKFNYMFSNKRLQYLSPLKFSVITK